MMKNPQETVGNLIEKQTICFISSVDEDGFPIQRQCYRLSKGKVSGFFIGTLMLCR
jgi:hypothetical protein